MGMRYYCVSLQLLDSARVPIYIVRRSRPTVRVPAGRRRHREGRVAETPCAYPFSRYATTRRAADGRFSFPESPANTARRPPVVIVTRIMLYSRV